jgi:hypothetical protein
MCGMDRTTRDCPRRTCNRRTDGWCPIASSHVLFRSVSSLLLRSSHPKADLDTTRHLSQVRRRHVEPPSSGRSLPSIAATGLHECFGRIEVNWYGEYMYLPSFPSPALLDETDSTSSLTELAEPCPSQATWLSARSPTTTQSSILSPRSSYMEHTRSWNGFHATSLSSPAPYGTVEATPRMDAAISAVTPTTPASSIPSSIQHCQPKLRPISRPSIDLEIAGYRPEEGPSPLLADQATAQHVYRAIRQHISDQLKTHPDWNSRTRERQQESHRENRKREKLATLNAEAAQDLKAAEQVLGISPGKDRRLVPKRAYDNNAWQAPPNGHHPRCPSLLAEDQSSTVDAMQTRRGRRSYPSSVESVYESSACSQTQTPESFILRSRAPSSLGDGSASSSGGSGESFALLRTPRMFEPRDINIVARSNGSPPRPLTHQRIDVQDQWEGAKGELPTSLPKPTPMLRRSRRFV